MKDINKSEDREVDMFIDVTDEDLPELDFTSLLFYIGTQVITGAVGFAILYYLI
jgi:hypothetical protein